MKKFDWVTDPHLDHCPPEAIQKLMSRLVLSEAHGIFLTGDIGNSHTVEHFLKNKFGAVRCTYFSLGNHDYYGSRISAVQSIVRAISNLGPKNTRNPTLFYMQDHDYVELTENTVLIGVDGWGDAHYGLGEDTPFLLNDFRLIEDFSRSDNKIRLCRSLGEEAAFLLSEKLEKVKDLQDNIVVLTHVPPFEENAHLVVPMGGPDLCGFFGCKAMGDVLLKFCADNPRKNVTVYSGHVHQKTDLNPLSNLRAITETAEYGEPKVVTVEIP